MYTTINIVITELSLDSKLVTISTRFPLAVASTTILSDSPKYIISGISKVALYNLLFLLIKAIIIINAAIITIPKNTRKIIALVLKFLILSINLSINVSLLKVTSLSEVSSNPKLSLSEKSSLAEEDSLLESPSISSTLLVLSKSLSLTISSLLLVFSS